MTRSGDRDFERTQVILREGGRVFGRYTLVTMLGRGGMGVVWRARDEKLERDVALKFLPDSVRDDPEAIRDLKRETRRCLDLTHLNIVRVYDFVEDNLAAAIAMEYVPGQSLAALKVARPGGCFDASDLAPLLPQLCAALDYAHWQAKVVHHDLKPGNLLVTPAGMLKVADFGIAKSLHEANSRRTGETRTTAGTLIFMGPQQLLNHRSHPADDVYALGATLYDLLTGKPPFYAGDLHAQICQVPAAPLASRRMDLRNTGAPIPQEWEEAVLACLAKRAEDRPASAGAVMAMLDRQNAPGEMTVPLSRTLPDPAPPRVKKKPRIESASANPGRPPAALASFVREFVVTVDPPDTGAHLWLGPHSNLAVPPEGRAVVKNLPDGEYELIVQAPGHQPLSARVTVRNGCGSAEAKLVAVKGAMEIAARAGTLVLAVDGRGRPTRIGSVPPDNVLRSDNLLTVGTYNFRFTHPECAEARQENIELRFGHVAKLAPLQVPLPGELRVFTLPTGAQVTVNGKPVGETPATLREQPSETELEIVVFARGYVRSVQTVTLKPKETRTLNLGSLKAASGAVELRFSTVDFRGEAPQVAVDGKAFNLGQVALPTAASPGGRRAHEPCKIEGLEEGARLIEIRHAGYEPWQQSVMVCDQQTVAVTVSLKPSSGRPADAKEGRPLANGRQSRMKSFWRDQVAPVSPILWVAFALTTAPVVLAVILSLKEVNPFAKPATKSAAALTLPNQEAKAAARTFVPAVKAKEPKAPPPEVEVGVNASSAFSDFVANAKISGVTQGGQPRALINDRSLRPGDTIDSGLGIVLEGIDPENRRVIFKDRTGAICVRRY